MARLSASEKNRRAAWNEKNTALPSTAPSAAISDSSSQWFSTASRRERSKCWSSSAWVSSWASVRRSGPEGWFVPMNTSCPLSEQLRGERVVEGLVQALHQLGVGHGVHGDRMLVSQAPDGLDLALRLG